jgi:hypothetical protein
MSLCVVTECISKVKSLFTRLSSTLRPPGSMTSGSIVFLPLTSSSRIHLQRRHASCRCARSLPAKVGTIPSPQFCHQSRNFRKNWWDYLHAAKLGHGTYYFTPLPKEGILRIFWMPEKSNGFGRV